MTARAIETAQIVAEKMPEVEFVQDELLCEVIPTMFPGLDLDAVAPVISMCFLTCYGVICLACGLERWAEAKRAAAEETAGALSERFPQFRHCHPVHRHLISDGSADRETCTPHPPGS